MDLKETSKNLNKSIWFYSPEDYLRPNIQRQLERENKFANSILSDKQVFNYSMVCFDKCVNTFMDEYLTIKENDCIKGCKKFIRNIISNESFLNID
jgi:hypothetical protein